MKKAYNYTIVIEKEFYNKRKVYVAHVPVLGISDFGKTVEDALKNTEKAIKLYIETLADLKKPIPSSEKEPFFVLVSPTLLPQLDHSPILRLCR